ncbi:met-10+ like-protein [Nitzschia inconspicua]|uniref:Met-10+ like-protein n=1 Tax=Nitzschia inconspicua TaxID=303405 RepID=A0A9K3Q849_9STRA|nr:met-10+ like-protein [Nitzschia inconspicua]
MGNKVHIGWSHLFSHSNPLLLVEAWTSPSLRMSSHRKCFHMASRWSSTFSPSRQSSLLSLSSQQSLPSATKNYPSCLFSSNSTANSDHFQEELTSNSTSTILSIDKDVRTMDPEQLLATWRELPVINPTVTFDTLLVPSSSLQTYVQHPSLQSILAKPTNCELLQHVHPRIKLVQDYKDDGAATGKKQLLLLSSSSFSNNIDHSDSSLQQLLDQDPAIERGPPLSISLSYQQLSFQYILQQLLPLHLLPPPSAYEQIGHIAHFNLKEPYQPYQQWIGQVLVATTPGIDTVVQKVGTVSGKYRTYQYEILADTRRPISQGNNQSTNNTISSSSSSSLETTHMEDGVQIQLNVAKCYWCTRLSGERQQVLQDILRSKQPNQSLVVADVFCGVGAVCLLLAKKRQQQQQQQQQTKIKSQKKRNKRDSGNDIPTKTSPSATTRIIANDWNPTAIEYFRRSIHGNNLNDSQFDLSCMEAYDFLIDLGSNEDNFENIAKDDRCGGGRGNESKQRNEPMACTLAFMFTPLQGPPRWGAMMKKK